MKDKDEMMGEKNHKKMSNGKYKNVLNKNDPVDQLIMEMAEKGILDVGFVEIRQESSAPEKHEFSNKPVLYYLNKNKYSGTKKRKTIIQKFFELWRFKEDEDYYNY